MKTELMKPRSVMLLSFASMIIGLGSLCFTATTRASRPPVVQEPITTTEVRIVDDKGKSRILMATMDDGEPAIILSNEKEEVRLTIALSKGRPANKLYDDKSTVRMRLYLDEHQGPSLAMFREKPNIPGALLGISETLGSTLILSRQEGSKAEVVIRTSSDGSPDVTLISKEGEHHVFDTNEKSKDK